MVHQFYKAIDNCDDNGHHQGNARACHTCGTVFCEACCSDKHNPIFGDPEWMTCPGCGAACPITVKKSEQYIKTANVLIKEPADVVMNDADIVILNGDDNVTKDID